MVWESQYWHKVHDLRLEEEENQIYWKRIDSLDQVQRYWQILENKINSLQSLANVTYGNILLVQMMNLMWKNVKIYQ